MATKNKITLGKVAVVSLLAFLGYKWYQSRNNNGGDGPDPTPDPEDEVPSTPGTIGYSGGEEEVFVREDSGDY